MDDAIDRPCDIVISDDEALQLADVLTSLLHAGTSVARALYEAPRWLGEPAAAQVRQHTTAIAVGRPIADVVGDLGRLHAALPPILTVLVHASADGSPVADHLQTLVAEVRGQRRRLLEQRLARLPIRLTLPIVACILPAFILLGILPLAVAVAPSLGTHP